MMCTMYAWHCALSVWIGGEACWYIVRATGGG